MSGSTMPFVAKPDIINIRYLHFRPLRDMFAGRYEWHFRELSQNRSPCSMDTRLHDTDQLCILLTETVP